MNVNKYKANTGETLNICGNCENDLEVNQTWPTDSRGDEYQICLGETEEECDLCTGD